jgi:hypothetical protein
LIHFSVVGTHNDTVRAYTNRYGKSERPVYGFLYKKKTKGTMAASKAWRFSSGSPHLTQKSSPCASLIGCLQKNNHPAKPTNLSKQEAEAASNVVSDLEFVGRFRRQTLSVLIA